MLDELRGFKVFFKIDLRSGYQIKYGFYERLVMSSGVPNASSTFMRLINEVFRPFNAMFVLLYFNNILVYSHDESSHGEHLSHVFQVLR